MNINHQIFRLSVPMIISNISTPILGLVDTAVMGHLDSAHYLAAVALSGIVFSFLFWGVGFLRMGTTGLTAQAFGAGRLSELKAILLRALLLAWLIACVLLSLQKIIAWLAFSLMHSSAEVDVLAVQYFDIRIWSAPAALSMYVISGWLIGMQQVKAALIMVLTTNISNIVLDIVFVYGLHMQVEGVALATVCAEYVGVLTGVLVLRHYWKQLHVVYSWSRVFSLHYFKSLLLININIFIRTWCLIFAFGFFTAKGALLGEAVLAANAVLLNFQTFMAYALDGFAHAAEALVGKSAGQKDIKLLRIQVRVAGFWCFIVACMFSLVYLFAGELIIQGLTNLQDVRKIAIHYLPWTVFMPLIAFGCYLFDGVFIGAMLSRQMRDSMLLALLLCYVPCWYFTQSLANDGLWLSMMCFMLARSLTMAFLYRQFHRKGFIE